MSPFKSSNRACFKRVSILTFKGVRKSISMKLVTGVGSLPLIMVAAQIQAARKNYPATFIVTIIVCAAMIWMFSGSPNSAALVASGAVLAAVSVVSLRMWRRDRAKGWVVTDATRSITENVLLAGATSVAWSIMLICGLDRASPEQAIIISAMTIGVMCVGALGWLTIPMASLSFIGGATIVVVVGTPMIDTPLPPAMYVFLALFVLMLVKTILPQGQLFIDNFYAGIRLIDAAHEKSAIEMEAERERETMAIAVERERVQSQMIVARVDAAAREEAAELRHAATMRFAEQFQETIVQAVAAFATAIDRSGSSARKIAQISAVSAEQACLATARAKDTEMTAVHMLDKAVSLTRSVDLVTAMIANQSQLSAEAASSTKESSLAIATLVTHTDGIDTILAMISELTAKTNLLALNAAIEASRAGDAGRGFAVVANEVKSLALQSRRAADEIGRQVMDMRDFVKSVAAINIRIAEKIRGVSSIAIEIDAAMADQQRSTRSIEHHATIAQIGTTELRAGVDATEHAAGESAALSQVMSVDAAALIEQSQSMARAATAFLLELHAA